MSADPTLRGTCKLRPDPAGDVLADVAAEYAALVEAHGASDVLVLKRHPAGLDSLTAALEAVDVDRPHAPRVESLPEHASKTLEAFDPTLERLEYEERIELISLVIDGADRDVPGYLERAAARDGFARDVGRLLLEATRQRVRLDDLEDPDDCLAFLYATNDRFHAELEKRGYVERADVVPRAVDLLEADADGVRSRLTDSFEAVLAVEFEEFRRLDRRYLAALTDDARLVCLGERHASVERSRVEPGRVDAVATAAGLEVERLAATDRPSAADSRTDASSPHGAITRFLATGEPPVAGADDPAGRAARIRARTSREQVAAVAAEIRSLCDREGWSFDDVAVAVPRADRIPDVRTRLREAGVPTATIGTPSLAEDPAVSELYALATLQGGRDGPDAATADRLEAARDRLAARVETLDADLLEACSGPGVERALHEWIRRTDLKGRIAREADWIDAREQFANVDRVLEIARFVEETDLVGPGWRGLRRMLRRTLRYDAPHVHAIEAQPPTGGVTVCAAADLKYDSREAVFLLDLVDDTYPGEQFLTRLFPTAWLREMAAYPAVTDPAPSTVAETFATVDDASDVADPFERYHAERSRRRLALGARAARSALYCCSYERGAGGLRRTYDESRYLQLLEATPEITLEAVDARETAGIRGETTAIETVLDQPRAELERVLREASTGGEADLAETEALLEEIAVVLEDGDVDDELADAVRSQFEFAAGEVRRRD